MSKQEKSNYSDSSTSSDRFIPFEITGRGINSQGNKWDTRVQPCGNGYHYSNKDGSYYYRNGDGSTYHNSPSHGVTYTNPDGTVRKW